MIDGFVRIAAAVRELPPESTQQAVGYPSLFLLVALGALVPVVPTGALVSSAAVVAFHQSSPLALLQELLAKIIPSETQKILSIYREYLEVLVAVLLLPLPLVWLYFL